MTNTPMTFEEWAKENMHAIDDMVYAKEIWQASQAQQASVIAELVEALEEYAVWEIVGKERAKVARNNAAKAIAKVKGK